MHLVPFGEVVPFRKSWPWMYRLLNRLTPYDYEYTLDVGEQATIFELSDTGGSPYRFGVAICYEDVMPHVPRQLAAIEANKKRLDFILNISNEGWYIRAQPDQSIQTTAELPQHMAICQFRAVENRVPIIRAVNMGISAFVRSDGSIQGKGLAGNLPAHVKDRQGVSGFLIDRVYLDSRITLYSKIGDIFSIVCTLITAFLLIMVGLATSLTQKKIRL
jgi:apolipoprotein N-acyltransferase